MNSLKNSILVSIYIGLFSCKCEYQCEISKEFLSNIDSLRLETTLTFKNQNNQVLSFVRDSNFITEPYSIKGKSGSWGCMYSEQCKVNSAFIYKSTSTIQNQDKIAYYASKRSSDPKRGGYNEGQFTLHVFDFKRTFLDLGYENQINFEGFDSLMINQPIGNNIYDSVYIYHIDFNLPSNSNLRIWRTYIHPRIGVVAFEDRLDNSLYVRQ